MFRKADTRKANQTIEGWEPLDSTTLALDGDGSLFALELAAEVTESHGWADAASKSMKEWAVKQHVRVPHSTCI